MVKRDHNKRRSFDVPAEDILHIFSTSKQEIPLCYNDITADQIICNTVANDLDQAKSKNMIWLAARYLPLKLLNADISNVPSWSGAHSLVSVKISHPTVIGSCRPIPPPPTSHNVVYTAIVNINKIVDGIGQYPTIITCDKAVYALAKEVLWSVKELDAGVLRMRGFHHTKNFLGVIGKRMSNSGFDQILEESGLYGTNHITGILTGKHYRGINAHTLFPEALYCLYYDSFKAWCEKEQHFDDELVAVVNSFEKSALEFAESFENGTKKENWFSHVSRYLFVNYLKQFTLTLPFSLKLCTTFIFCCRIVHETQRTHNV